MAGLKFFSFFSHVWASTELLKSYAISFHLSTYFLFRNDKPRSLGISPLPEPHLLPWNLETVSGMENWALIKMFLIFFLQIFSLNITVNNTDGAGDRAWEKLWWREQITSSRLACIVLFQLLWMTIEKYFLLMFY